MGRTPLGDGQREVGAGRRSDRALHLREDVGSWVLCTRDLRGRIQPRLARRSQYWNRTRDSPMEERSRMSAFRFAPAVLPQRTFLYASVRSSSRAEIPSILERSSLSVFTVLTGRVTLFNLVALFKLLFSAREGELQFHKTARNIHGNWH